MANDKPTESEAKKLRPEDTIWVICASPVTLLMPLSGGREAPLKLERGLNVLVGPVALADGSTRHLTLDGLPANIQQLPVEQRGAEVHKLFSEARKRYAQYFAPVGAGSSAIPARISAVGTMAQLQSEHFAELLEGARLGTHRASLEGLVHFPGEKLPAHVKDLARARLAAWRPAA